MKLTIETLEFLKSFTLINPSIAINQGNILRTISPQESIIAKVEVSEKFEQDFAIYDLGQFISLFHIVDSINELPEVIFEDKQLVVKSNKDVEVNYTYTDPSLIKKPPQQDIDLPDENLIEFSVTGEDIKQILKAAAVLQVEDLAFIGNGKVINFVAFSQDNPTSNIYKRKVGTTDKEFVMIIKLENFRVLNKDYKVKLSPEGICQLHNEEKKLTYWIALEQSSKFIG